MSKRYTADEMREMADCVERDVFSDGRGNYDANGFMGFDPDIISSMLRQKADNLEREEKRDRKYEYAVKEFGSYIHPVHSDSATAIDGLSRGDDHCVIVRREVGDWEEVPNV